MGCIKSKKPIIPVFIKNSSPEFSHSNHIKSIQNDPEILLNDSTKNLAQTANSLSNKIRIGINIKENKTRGEDNYTVLSKIGKASFGSVYKVLDKHNTIIRAMKVISREAISYQDDEKVFLKEIEILTKLEHPNIIKIIEYYTDDINYYIIMEYIEGGELYDVINKMQTLTESKAAYIMKQILCALNYLHSFNIVHRDIKPENMLVESTSKDDKINIKLIDFVTCHYVKENESFSQKIGSPYYMAPEVLNKKYNQKCDIWSAGVILYILLIGSPPFNGNNLKELFHAIKKGVFNKEGDEWNQISSNAKDLISKMLLVDPEERISAQASLEHPWFDILNQNGNTTQMENFPNVLTNIWTFNVKEKLQQAAIAYIMHSLYLNKEMISYEEFLRAGVNQKELLDENNLRLSFDRFDLNKDGMLSKEELRLVLGATEYDYINTLLKLIDENKDDCLSFDEFKTLMKEVVLSNKNDTHFFFNRPESSSNLSVEGQNIK